MENNINLNASQQQAVDFPGRHLLIVAGPGTGKTHTLTHRIAKSAQLLPPDEKILAITFTNKAAAEMRERLAGRMKRVEDKVTIGTFHQFGLQVLRQFGRGTSLPEDFSIAGPKLVEQAARNLWPDCSAKTVKERLIAVSFWKSIGFDQPAPQTTLSFNKRLREAGYLDFDDLLLEAFNVLRNSHRALIQVQSEYRQIFVDEYQDINAIQLALLKLLAGESGAVSAIGDPNQAIYGFRGCDVRFFETFTQDFPNAQVLTLSENYRSARNLLCASGQIMAGSNSMHVPALTARIYQEGRLTVYAAPTEKAEAEYVVHQTERIVGGTSMFSQDSGRVATQEEGEHSFGDIAVLYRLNSQSFALQKAFERSGVPYQVSGAVPKDDPQDELDHFSLSKIDEPDVVAEKVSLMTIHAAKGLEFPVVFMVGCEQNILPLNLDSFTADKDEERRLFYVGMTRAKDSLYLIRAKRRCFFGKSLKNAPSEFLTDIEDGLKEYDLPAGPTRRRKTKDEQMSLF